MYLDILSACISMYQIHRVIGDQQRDPLGLEVQGNVSHYVDTGKQPCPQKCRECFHNEHNSSTFIF